MQRRTFLGFMLGALTLATTSLAAPAEASWLSQGARRTGRAVGRAGRAANRGVTRAGRSVGLGSRRVRRSAERGSRRVGRAVFGRPRRR